MRVEELYAKLAQVKVLPYYSHFSFWFHGGILESPHSTNDIDVKIQPRTKPITLDMLQKTMLSLINIGIEPVFFKEVQTWPGKLKPTLKEIDGLEPVFQAVYGKDINDLLEQKKDNSMYHYRGGVTYKQIENLIFYKSSEWAICGHKYNQNWKMLSEEVRQDRREMERLHTEGYLHREYSKQHTLRNIEIREFFYNPMPSNWTEFRNKYRSSL